MSKNLYHYVSEKINDAAISKLGSILDINIDDAQLAVDTALPDILQAIINKGENYEDVSALRGFVRTNNIASNVATDFLNLDFDSREEYIGIGSKATNFIFGDEKDSAIDGIVNKSQLNHDNGSKLIKLIAPLALGHVSKLANRENYTDVQLAAYLKSQKENYATSNTQKNTGSTQRQTKNKENSEESTVTNTNLLKLLLPFLGLVLLIWWFSQKSCADQNTETAESSVIKNSEQATKNSIKTKEATNSSNVTKTGWKVDGKGDLVDGNGKLVFKAGEFSIVDGYYTDSSGEKFSPVSNVFNTINSGGDFKKVFSDMLSSTEKLGTTYALSQIVFDKDSHKINDFSKAELEGLANALKAMPKAKIQVQVHSNDGDDKTKLRAQVVKDMLVTLGVNKTQISSRGMGKEDATKAANNKVEIKVEQSGK